ncbi:MAG: DUF5131 family protein [Betaproteobacteria bacterium]|nr:MAG: DUF5131 family protein [Betaproteobacteria bacterium]
MSQNSTIEWTQKTWNPITGCTRISPGCMNCYAETLAARWKKAHEGRAKKARAKLDAATEQGALQ